MPIPSDFPGMTSSQLDGFIADFLSAIYGEEVRDKFARIAYLIGHQLQEDAQASLDSAAASAQAAAASADEAETANQAAQAAKADAQSSKTAAAASAEAAQESANAAADSETAAAGSATAAANSASNAQNSATSAAGSANQAYGSQQNAAGSASAAAESAQQAASNANAAQESAAAAAASETAAKASETAAASSEQNAAQSADEAYTWNKNSLTLYTSTEDLRDQTQAYYTEILQTELEHNVEILSQAAFDAITPAPNRLYIIDNGPNPYLRGLFPLKSDGKNVFDETQSATGVGKISYDGDSCTFGVEETSLAELIGAGTYDLIIPPVVTSQWTVEDALTVEGKDIIVQSINSSFLLLPITNLGLEAGKTYQVHGQLDSTEGLDVSHAAIVSLVKTVPQSVTDIMEQKAIASFTTGEYEGVFEAPSDLAEYQYLLFTNCGDNTITIELNYSSQHTNYLTLPNTLFSGEDYSNGLTVSLEVCPAVYADWTRIFQFYAPPTETQTEGDLYATQGVTVTGFWNSTQIQQMGYTNYRVITPDVWHQIAFVVSPSALMMYVDGQLVTTATDTGTTLSGILANLSSFTQNWIGNSRFEDDDFSGKIRAFRIFAKALSQEEVQQIGGEVTWKLYWGEKELDLHDLPLTGGTMEGPVNMDGHALTGLPDPASDTDAVPKSWADGQYTPLTAAIRPTVTGNPITVTDSAEAPVLGLCVYGRTEQATTTGAQLWNGKWVNVNLGGEYDDYSEGYIPGNMAMPVVSGNQYTLSKNGDVVSIRYKFLDASKAELTQLTSNTITASAPENAAYMQWRLHDYSSYENGDEIMLNAGSTALPWEPYTGGQPSPSPEYPQELVSAGDDGKIDVTVCGAQLFDVNGIEPLTPSTTVSYYPLHVGPGNFTLSSDIPKVSGNCNLFLLAGNVSNGANSTMNGVSIEQSRTVESTEDYVTIGLRNMDNINSLDYNIMLNAGSTALPWEPYTGKTLTLTGELPGLPVDSGGNYTDPDGQQWYADIIDYEKKKKLQYVEIQTKWESLSQSLFSVDTNTVRFGVNHIGLGAIYSIKCLCNVLPYKSCWSLDEEGVYSDVNHIVFRVPKDVVGETTMEGALQWLKDNNVVVIWALKDPVETPIPAEELAAYKALKTYDGTTNVTAADGAGLSLRYVADTQKYIDNKIAAISAAMLEG